jgi:excisionase family DNA binding protein
MYELLNEEDMAQRLSCSPRHVRRLRDEGQIPCLRLGGLVRYDPEAVLRALQQYALDQMKAGQAARPQ